MARFTNGIRAGRPGGGDDVARRRLMLLSEHLATSTDPSTGGPTEPSPAAHGDPSRGVTTKGSGAPPDAPPISTTEMHQAEISSPTDTPHAPLRRPHPPGAEPPQTAGRHLATSLPWWQRLAGALRDRAPTGSYGLSTAHVMVLALVSTAALSVTLWWLLGARPQALSPTDTLSLQSPSPPTPTAFAPGTGTSAGAGTATGTSAVTPSAVGPAGEAAPGVSPPAGSGADTQNSSASSPAAEVVVDVAGKVRRPGIVTLPAGARVADALEAAGGVRPRVDTTSLNLARPLVDGEQILVGLAPLAVPTAGTPTATPGTTGPATLIDLNTATMAELDTLPGVGPVTAQAILDWRADNGAFTSVDELLEVSGIGDATLADLRDLVTV